MKKKIVLALVLSFVMMCIFAVAVSATGFDYKEKATLADGTVLPIYDENQNPLIWWVSGTENGKNVYSSVPNNRNEANASHDTYVTFANDSQNKDQLRYIKIHIYDDDDGFFETITIGE